MEALMLTKKIVAVGSSWGVIIPKSLLAVMGINPVLDKITFEMEPDGLKLKKAKRED